MSLLDRLLYAPQRVIAAVLLDLAFLALALRALGRRLSRPSQ